MSNRPRPDRKELRRTEALEREVAWRALSPEDQLHALHSRLHLGRSYRQRLRIAAKAGLPVPAEPLNYANWRRT